MQAIVSSLDVLNIFQVYPITLKGTEIVRKFQCEADSM